MKKKLLAIEKNYACCWRKIAQLESTINQKQIPQADKQILLQEVENLKQTLAEHQQKKVKKRNSFISYPKTK